MDKATPASLCPGHGPAKSYHCHGQVKIQDGSLAAPCFADCPKHAAIRAQGEKVWTSLEPAFDCYGILQTFHYHSDILGCVSACFEPLSLLPVVA